MRSLSQPSKRPTNQSTIQTTKQMPSMAANTVSKRQLKRLKRQCAQLNNSINSFEKLSLTFKACPLSTAALSLPNSSCCHGILTCIFLLHNHFSFDFVAAAPPLPPAPARTRTLKQIVTVVFLPALSPCSQRQGASLVHCLLCFFPRPFLFLLLQLRHMHLKSHLLCYIMPFFYCFFLVLLYLQLLLCCAVEMAHFKRAADFQRFNAI